MKCSDKEWQHCRVEKMGCKGCYYDEAESKELMEKVVKQYETIVKSNLNLDAEIDCIVRQKQTATSNYAELIKAQSKLNNAEYLLKNILNDLNKYLIVEIDIKKQIQIASQKSFQNKQTELNKKYERR